MSLQVEPPEKKKRKKKTTNSSPPAPPLPPSFSLFPDEITVDYLSRISRSYYPTLSIISKTVCSILSSTELYEVRSQLRRTEQCVYVCLSDRRFRFPQWFTLWVNPNRAALSDDSVSMKRKNKTTIGQLLVPITEWINHPNRALPDSLIMKRRKKEKKTIEQLLVPMIISSSNLPSASKATVVVGSEIYVIGGLVDSAPSSVVRVLDCRSHTWRDAPSMIVARKNALSCVYAGKIYVMGGSDESLAEVFDMKTRTWERLPNPDGVIRSYPIEQIAEIDGKILFMNQRYMLNYDPKQCKWEKSSMFSGGFSGGCLMEDVWYRVCSGFLMWSTNKLWYSEVKGLGSLEEEMNMSDNKAKLVSCVGGKLLIFWEGYLKKHCSNNKKQICCAEIVIEKRDGGEVWGKAEWVDVVLLKVPRSCQLLHSLVVPV